MPSKNPAERSVTAKFAAASRWGKLPSDVAESQRDLKAARLADHIRKVVDSAPPLTAAQRDRLALLLTGGAA